MRETEFSFHALDYPFPDDFLDWYPYTKPEIIGDSHWAPWLRRIVSEQVPGVRDRFVAARHEPSGAWAGVVWASVSKTTPELAHFGWFFVEDRWQGSGVGDRIVKTYLDVVEAEGVRVVMLPTQVENERAVGFYYRRGWQLTLVDAEGGVWMTREPAGYYQAFFRADPERGFQAGPPELADFLALDYLLGRPTAAIRLLPLGLVGSRRFVSFCTNWEAARYAVARQSGRPLAVAAGVPGNASVHLDAFGLDAAAMAAALQPLVERAADTYALAAVGDAERRAAFEAVGLRVAETVTQEVAGAPMRLCRYVR